MNLTMTKALSDRDRDQVSRTRIRTKRSWKEPLQEVKPEFNPPREYKPMGVDAQELRMRLEAYIAEAGPHVLGITGHENRTEEKWDSIEVKPRKSIYVEELPENGQLHHTDVFNGFQYPPPETNHNDAPKDRPQETCSRYFPLQLPEIEIMKSGELFSPHMLGLVEEVDEPPEMEEDKSTTHQTESTQSGSSPTSTLRRVIPLEDPRKVYISQQQIEEELSSKQTKPETDLLEESRREAAETKSELLPNGLHNEQRLNGKTSRTRPLSTHYLLGSKPISKITRFAEESQVWNGVDKLDRNTIEERRRSLPLISMIKRDSGIGSDIIATPEQGRHSPVRVRRGSMPWRLLGKKDKGDGVGTNELAPLSSKALNRKSNNLGFLNIFKR